MSSNSNYEFVLERINVPDTIVLDKREHTYTCGRARDNQIVCLSVTVSRRHCIFFCGKDGLYVTDLKSSNGLFINGRPQEPYQTIKLSENDIIGIGCPEINADNSMFAYKLCITKVPEKKQDISVISNLSKTILNASNTSTNAVPEDNPDLMVKRKREKPACQTVVPHKILKLNNEEHRIRNESSAEFIKVAGKNELKDEIEIVHVSLKNDTSEQSIRNSNSTSLNNGETINKINLNVHTVSGVFEQADTTRSTKEIMSPVNSERKSIHFTNSKENEQFVLNNILNDIKTENSITSNRSKQVNKEITVRNNSSKKCKETNLSHSHETSSEQRKQIKNTEMNSNNSSNTKIQNKIKNNNLKTKTQVENRTCNSKRILNSRSETSNDLNEPHTSSSCHAANHSIGKNNTSETLAANFIQNGDTLIKLEDELQLTDTDEDAILNSTNFDLNSPVKLKMVQQAPKTRFSEVDVVNLSDNEDDIFPCSQLFDTGFGQDISDEQQIKEEPTEIDNDRFNRFDDTEIVILTDSEDEDNTWLHRLSRSQILNENEEVGIDTNKENKEAIKMEILDIEDTTHPSNEGIFKPQSTKPCMSIKREEERRNDENIRVKHTHKNQDISHALKDTVDANEMHMSSSYNVEKIESDNSELVSHKENNHSKENISTDFMQNAVVTLTRLSDSNIEDYNTHPKKRNSLQKRIPEVEPPHMPTGRRRSSTPAKAKEISEKPVTPKLNAKEKKELQEKAKIEQHLYNKDQKYRKMLHKWAECLPPGKKKDAVLTKEQKKMLQDDRKAKLKKLAMEEKRLSLEDNQEKKRIVIKPKAKVSAKTRGDFLVSEQSSPSTSKLEESIEKSKNTINYPTPKDSIILTQKTNKTTSNRDTSKEITNKITNDLQRSLILTEPSDKGKILKKDNNIKKAKTAHTPEEMLKGLTLDKRQKKIKKLVPNTITEELQLKDKSKVEYHKPAQRKSILRSTLNTTSGEKQKKRLSFCTVIKTVHEYEIDTQNILRKFTGKDAPIPIEKLPIKVSKNITEPGPKLEEFLLRILSWNPVWLEEQTHLKSIAPVVREDELHPMLTHYKSYNEYYKNVAPLLLLEIWCGITKEFQNTEQNFRRPTLMCSIVENSIAHSNIPSTNVRLSTLMLEVLVTKQDVTRQAYPNYGDLVFFEYARNEGKGQTFHKIFAYVTNVYQTVLTSLTHYNKDLNNYVKHPYALLTFTMMTKPLEQNILVNRVQRLRAVTYLRSNLRMVQALQYLPNSPVMNLILNPKIEMYRLPQVFEAQTCSLVTKDKLNEKQLEAVLKVTEAVVQKDAKLCFIQGPPGTGKSKVIVNIVTQILYGGNRYNNNGGSLRILVCAPSNAAIDEIVLRLLNIRSTIRQNRFKMVRIGRPESMHPSVKDISLTELAKRDVKRTASSYASSNIPIDSVEEEKLFLEARINALKCEIATSHKVDEAYKKHIKMKLADMTAKYELLRNRKPIDEINPKELAKLQRAAENRLLTHADIITCTLSSCYTNQMESIFGGNRERISVCIVDEATQSCEAETLIPLMLGVKTLVLVGDPNQLPATILSQTAKKYGLDQSIFSRVQNAFEGQPNNPIIMLETQYRMQYDISYWPNRFFYGGKLNNAPECNLNFPFHPYRILNINANQNHDKFSNTDEAEFVANMISCMITFSNFDHWESSVSLGILTPYQNQKSIISTKIHEKMSSVPDSIKKKMKIEVNTVDSFQGQERDIVIMSCVRSQGIGFLSDKQRLCVALTRAKHSLIMCGNFNIFMRDQMWNALLSDARSRGVYFNVSANAHKQEIRKLVVKHTR